MRRPKHVLRQMVSMTGCAIWILATDDYVQTRNHQENVRLNPLDYGQSEETALSISENFRV